MAVAVFAVACAWPERFAMASIMFLSRLFTLRVILSENRMVHRLFELLIVAAILGCVASLMLW